MRVGGWKKKAIFLMRMFLSLSIIVIVICVCGKTIKSEKSEKPLFSGEGTYEDPYRIECVEDLEQLAVQVNSGNEYSGVYFCQEEDLDFSSYGNWTPIGTFDSGYAFSGVYDGKGHSIQNITIDGNQLSHASVGLFGMLAGKVCNLKIESGTITGAYIGSITSHGRGDQAVIVNCYNQASLVASGRCGGIADNLGGGKIICCANTGSLEGPVKGGIVSFAAGEVYGCFSTEEPVPENYYGKVTDTEKVDDVYLGIADKKLKSARFLYDIQNLRLKAWG